MKEKIRNASIIAFCSIPVVMFVITVARYAWLIVAGN